MERVVTINLNGNPFQLEEPAYDALRAYLAGAEAALNDNPDKIEIVRDLEQAIADKCADYLGPHKAVIAAAEMTHILSEMGPVECETTEGAAARDEQPSTEGPSRRLYRIRDGAKVAGVCTGLGAYFDLDPNVIRVLFILAAIFMSGLGVLVYIVMMFAVPSAHTSAEWAAAHGVPFNAQEIIDRAKREYGKFEQNASRGWRARSWRGGGGHREPPPAPVAPVKPVGYVERMFAGLFALVFSIVTAALLIAFLIVFFSLLGQGHVFGWTPPDGAPLWLVLVIAAIAYAALSAPFSGLRRASYATLSGRRDHGGGDGFATVAIAALAAWFAWAYIPEARQMMEEAYVLVRNFVTHWNSHWDWNWD